MEFSSVVPENVACPIVVTLAGIVIEASEVDPSKALIPIEASRLPSAKVTVVSEDVLLNALCPIDVTLAGIVTEASDPAELNA
jgi:hypothetical protein